MPAFRLPAEYEPQAAVWLTWPGNPATWTRCRPAAEQAYAAFAAEISRRQPLELTCCAAWQPHARRLLHDTGADLHATTFHDWPSNDAWCRDHGPLFVHTADGGHAVLDLPYNAWGGKFPPWDDDDAIARRVSEVRNLPCHRLPNFGEGGAIEVNREGVMLTTESVWLNPNRNPGISKAGVERLFADFFGVRETFWLPGGMVGDDTDGHIDTITRFVNDSTVVSVLPEESDPNYRILRDNYDKLTERFEVIPLPHPAPIRPEDWREELLPATYANFLILNDAVLVPAYRQPDRDQAALRVLRDAFPDREVLPLDCGDIIWEGGALHCLSMQEPV